VIFENLIKVTPHEQCCPTLSVEFLVGCRQLVGYAW